MSRHYKKLEPKYLICVNCRLGVCEKCVDELRKNYADNPLCECDKKDHPIWEPIKVVYSANNP